MKKIPAIIILSVYLLAFYCLSFMSIMPSSGMMNILKNEGSAVRTVIIASPEALSSAQAVMDCKSCWISQSIVDGLKSNFFSLLVVEGILVLAFFLFLVTFSNHVLRVLVGRSPPPILLFKSHFLRQHQTVVLRN